MMEPEYDLRMRREQSSSCVTAFSLIELMVVLSIVALLVAILLPSLGRAREEAKKTVCLANLHQLGIGIENYVLSENAYPIWLIEGEGNTVGFCSWAWGGKTTSLTPWREHGNGIFYFRANEKPVNRSLGISYVAEPTPITDDSQRSELKVFRCPSDKTSWQALWHTEELTHHPAYEDVGTSYQFNYHWYEQARRVDESGARQLDWGQELFMRRRMRGASRFLLLVEDSLDRSIASRIETLGLHRRWAVHNVLMLDGHAQVLRVPVADLDRVPDPLGA